MSGTDVERHDESKIAPAVVQTLNNMLLLLPESTTDDAETRILEQILGATTTEDVDSPWDSMGFGKYVNVPLRVEKMRRMESDFKGDGIGWYLIAECRRMDTGESVVVTTGSPYIIAQLMRAHTLGDIPSDWRCVEKVTDAGYRAQHLEYLGKPFDPETPG